MKKLLIVILLLSSCAPRLTAIQKNERRRTVKAVPMYFALGFAGAAFFKYR